MWRPMQKLITIILFFAGSMISAPKTMAQDNSFREEVSWVLQDGFIPLEKDDWILWHGAGSKWKLTSSDGAPNDFAKHMDAFIWQGSRLMFSSEFCRENYGFKNYIFSMHLDLSQSNNSYSDRRLILSTLPKDRGEPGCPKIQNVGNYLGAVSTFEFSASGNGEIWLNFRDREEQTFTLSYKRDHLAERVLQSKWKLTSENLTPAKSCGPLTIRPHGNEPAPFIDTDEFYVDGAGWWPDNPESPIMVYGCSDKNERARDAIQSKLRKQFEIDRNGHLIADPSGDDPLVFEPAGVLSDIKGKYKLMGLELKTYNPLFQAAPFERKITDQRALRKLGFNLEVKETQISFSGKCWTHTGEVSRRKSDVVLIEGVAFNSTRNCKSSNKSTDRIKKYIYTIVGENAVVKITYDKTTQQLTLTRGIIGPGARTLNWVFERQ